MHLQNLTINNFRPFAYERDTNIDLNHSVVLFYGPNGTGKSSIFDAFELALTGRIGRLTSIDTIGSVLVNARSAYDRAKLSLEWSPDGNTHRTEIEIQRSQSSLTVRPALTLRQCHLFQYATYLAQANIQRLLQAGPLDLGDIIRKLIVDERIDMLFQGISSAGISRHEQAYQRIKQGDEYLRHSLSELDSQITAVRNVIDTVRSARVSIDQLINRLVPVAEGIAIDIDKSKLKSVSELANQVSKVTQELQERLTKENLEGERAKHAVALGNQLLEDERSIRDISHQLSTKNKYMEEIQRDIDAIEQRLTQAEREITSRESVDSPFQALGLLLRILEETEQIADLNVCPICDRPYNDLKNHIKDKRASLSREQSDFQRRLNELRAGVQSSRDSRRRLLSDFDRVKSETADLQSRIDSLQERKDKFLIEHRPILGRECEIEEALDYEKSVIMRVEKVTRDLAKLAEDMAEIRSELLAATTGLTRKEEELLSMQKKRKALAEKLDAASKARTRLESFIDTTHSVHRALSTQVEDILRDFINTRAKDAFVTLFDRMARHRYFQVTIPEVRVRYHRPEVEWRATYRGRTFSGEAVLSYGELNTCALSFFLAMAISQPHHLGFVLLDDPVQNMDELHIEELAQVLKSLKDDLGWQLVVGLHDESVFDYLKRQLLPSREGQSLVSYRLVLASDGPLVEEEVSLGFERDSFLTLATKDAA